MSLLDHPLISQRYFFPRPGRPPSVWEVTAADGSRLACYRRPWPQARLTVVFYHGNGEIVADYVPEFANELPGVNLVLAEYRGYGASSGRPALAAMLDDIPRLFEALDTPPEQLVLYGRSIGSLYAIDFAHRFGVGGLILESGIADLLERVLLRVSPHELGVSQADLEGEVARHFDHRQKLGAYRGPLLALHARHDDLVYPVHAERNVSWAGGPAQLVLFERGDHNSICLANRKAYFLAVREFLSRVEEAAR